MRFCSPSVLWLSCALTATACSQQAPVRPSPSSEAAGAALSAGGPAAAAATPMTATIKFGHAGVGSGFPPPEEHDQSGHAADKLVPSTVVIATGGTVTFETFGVHQIAIYEPGTRPEDIDTSQVTAAPAGCPPIPLIDDATNRVATINKPCGPPVTLSYTFTSPGRYLVICSFLPHFVDFRMYGWVIVQ